jgi:hypothetical protein
LYEINLLPREFKTKGLKGQFLPGRAPKVFSEAKMSEIEEKKTKV